MKGKEKTFVQCCLEKHDESGKVVLISWIPERFAKKGKILALKPKVNEVFENGWVVSKIFGKKQLNELITLESQHKHNRDVTDV